MQLRFTIRDSIWLAILVATAVGWWISSRSLQRRCDLLEDQLLVVESDYKQLQSTVERVRKVIGDDNRILWPPAKPEKPGHLIGTIPDRSIPETNPPTRSD